MWGSLPQLAGLRPRHSRQASSSNSALAGGYRRESSSRVPEDRRNRHAGVSAAQRRVVFRVAAWVAGSLESVSGDKNRRLVVGF